MSPSNPFKNNAEASEAEIEEVFAAVIEEEVDSDLIGVVIEVVTEVVSEVTIEVTPHKEAIEEGAKEVSVLIGQVVDFLHEEATMVVIGDLGIIIHLNKLLFQSIYLVFEEMQATQQDWLHKSHLISVTCCLFVD